MPPASSYFSGLCRWPRGRDPPVWIVDHEQAVAAEEVACQLPGGVCPQLQFHGVTFGVNYCSHCLEAHSLAIMSIQSSCAWHHIISRLHTLTAIN